MCGVCQKCGQFLYAWCVMVSTILFRCAGTERERERELRSEVVYSPWPFAWSTVMVAGSVSLTLYILCILSQYGWMEKGCHESA